MYLGSKEEQEVTISPLVVYNITIIPDQCKIFFKIRTDRTDESAPRLFCLGALQNSGIPSYRLTGAAMH